MQMGHAHDNVKELVEVIHAAEVVVVGAGSGLSTAAGLTYGNTDLFKAQRAAGAARAGARGYPMI